MIQSVFLYFYVLQALFRFRYERSLMYGCFVTGCMLEFFCFTQLFTQIYNISRVRWNQWVNLNKGQTWNDVFSRSLNWPQVDHSKWRKNNWKETSRSFLSCTLSVCVLFSKGCNMKSFWISMSLFTAIFWFCSTYKGKSEKQVIKSFR